MTATEYLQQVSTYRNNVIRAHRIGDKDRIEHCEGEYKALACKVTDQLENLGNEKYTIILFAKHIEKKTLAQIAAELKYNYGYVRNLHTEALRAFEAKYLQGD